MKIYEFLKMKYKKMALPMKASVWFVICSFIQKSIAFFTTPIFTRLLTQEEYGSVSIYLSWLSIITIFATLELPQGVFNKAMIKYEKDRDGYTSSSLALTSLITFIFFLIYLCFNNIFDKILGLSFYIMVLMFVDIFFSTAMSLWAIRNKFDYNYQPFVIVTLITSIVTVLLSLFMVLISDSNRDQARILGMVLTHIIVYSIIFAKIIIKGKKLYVSEYWKYSVFYNLPLVLHYLSQQILNQSDRIMIDRYCGKADAAIYSLAYQIAIIMLIVINAIHASFTPWMYQCIKDNNCSLIGKRAFQIEILIGTLCLSFSLFAPEFVLILGGDSYYQAIFIIPPVSMSLFFITIYNFFASVELYFEKTKFVMVASCFAAILNIILNAIFIPIFGFIAAGYTTLVSYIIYSIIHYICMKKVCKRYNFSNPFFIKATCLVAVVLLILSIGISYLYQFFFLRYVVIILLLFLLVIYIRKIYLIKCKA